MFIKSLQITEVHGRKEEKYNKLKNEYNLCTIKVSQY